MESKKPQEADQFNDWCFDLKCRGCGELLTTIPLLHFSAAVAQQQREREEEGELGGGGGEGVLKGYVTAAGAEGCCQAGRGEVRWGTTGSK